ncbi:MAG: hypothetical protein Q9226_008836, partial [Calogaya cf. arnoldii]
MSPQWQNLPNGIFYEILYNIPDFLTLSNLLQAHPLQKQLFTQRYRLILCKTLKRTLPRQYQKLAGTILSLRYGTLSSALTDLVQIHLDIKYWMETFFKACGRQPHVIDTQEGCTVEAESQASQTELYRIRRALWRFWLLCHLASYDSTMLATTEPVPTATPQTTLETFYQPKLPSFWSILRCPREPIGQLMRFKETMTDWESEELECVYYFLQDEYERHRREVRLLTNCGTGTALVKETSPPIRRLLLTMGYKSLEIAPESLEACERYNTLNSRIFTYRLIHTRHVRTVWPDAQPEIHTANYGFRVYYENTVSSPGPIDDYYYDEAPSPECSDPDRGPVVCFLRWGYCMWDRERLLRWGVLEKDQHGK